MNSGLNFFVESCLSGESRLRQRVLIASVSFPPESCSGESFLSESCFGEFSSVILSQSIVPR